MDTSQQQPEPVDDEDDSVDLFRAIGRQVKLLRERAGLKQRELGKELGYGVDLISSMERGCRTPQPEFLDAADDFLKADGLLKATKEDVLRAKAKARVRHPAWFRDYARLEAQATEVSFYSTVTVPGLLQSEAYARFTFAVRQPLLDEETIERRVAARLARQEVLNRWPPPVVTAVLDESILLRKLGGDEVHRGQLEHLLKLGRLRSTTLQVMPLECADNPGIDGPFVLLAPKDRPHVAYMEVQGISRLLTEPADIRSLAARYGSIRGQALAPRESLDLIEKILGGQ